MHQHLRQVGAAGSRDGTDFEKEETQSGVKYIVWGQVETPNDDLSSVVTVWITEIAVSKPRSEQSRYL